MPSTLQFSYEGSSVLYRGERGAFDDASGDVGVPHRHEVDATRVRTERFN